MRQWAASRLTQVGGFAIIPAHLLLRMNFTHLAVLSIGLSLCFVSAQEDEVVTYNDTVWAQGVDVDRNVGWYDANKVNNSDGDADDNMCYAASAANLIAWWQNGDYGKPSSAPRELADIWEKYVNNNQDEDAGGDPGCAINWWISGVYSPTHEQGELSDSGRDEWERFYADEISNDDYVSTLKPFDGYYFDRYGLKQEDLGELITDVWNFDASEETASWLSLQFDDLFEGSAGIALAIASENSELAHAITLWGAEYNEKGDLAKLWLTDSDDYGDKPNKGDYYDPDTNSRLFSVVVEIKKDDDGVEKIYLTGDGSIYDSGAYIDAVYALDASVSAGWTLVPEPTSATLSLLALAALAARRRR